MSSYPPKNHKTEKNLPRYFIFCRFPVYTYMKRHIRINRETENTIVKQITKLHKKRGSVHFLGA